MGGTDILEEPVLKIKLLVDMEKNKVVLAEVGKDFVDVLFSFLVLPMGTIVRLLEKHQQNQKSQATKIGCFNNLYESVRNMDTDDFLTEACKHALLYTRSVKESECRQLKINIDDNEVLKYYKCSKTGSPKACFGAYSNFCSSRCSCGSLMNVEFEANVGNTDDELFDVKNKSSIVSDNMEMGPASISLMMKTIKGLGYADAGKLQEILVDVNHEKVLALLECLFSSDTPLTDVFLKNRSSYVTRSRNMSSLTTQYVGKKILHRKFSITVFVRKQDRKVIYAECREDFVDLLFTVLAVPLKFIWELSRSNIILGCIGNYCKSIESCGQEANLSTDILHWHYDTSERLLEYIFPNGKFRTITSSKNFMNHHGLKPLHPNGRKIYPIHYIGEGFVKGERMYMISDDLTIKPINPSSTFTMMKKLETDLDNIEDHVIEIGQDEVARLMIASFMTSTALTTALGCLIPKNEA